MAPRSRSPVSQPGDSADTAALGCSVRQLAARTDRTTGGGRPASSRWSTEALAHTPVRPSPPEDAERRPSDRHDGSEHAPEFLGIKEVARSRRRIHAHRQKGLLRRTGGRPRPRDRTSQLRCWRQLLECSDVGECPLARRTVGSQDSRIYHTTSIWIPLATALPCAARTTQRPAVLAESRLVLGPSCARGRRQRQCRQIVSRHATDAGSQAGERSRRGSRR